MEIWAINQYRGINWYKLSIPWNVFNKQFLAIETC